MGFADVRSHTRRGLALLALLLFATTTLSAEPPKAKPTPKFTLSKETTFVTEPLDKDGYIDYETALNDRLRGNLKPEDNAVVLLIQAIGPKPDGRAFPAEFYDWLGTKPPPEKGEYLIPSTVFFREEERGERKEAFWELQAQLHKAPWNGKDHSRFVDWLKANERPLEQIARASMRTHFYEPVVVARRGDKRGTLFGAGSSVVSSSIRHAAELLQIRAMLLLGEGRTDDAWKDLLTLHRLARLASRGGSMMQILLGCAIEAVAINTHLALLEHVRPDSKKLEQFARGIRELPARGDIEAMVDLQERLTTLEFVQYLRQHGLSVLERILEVRSVIDSVMSALDGRGGGDDGGFIRYVLVDGLGGLADWEFVMKKTNRWVERQVKIVHLTDRVARTKAWADFEIEMKSMKANTAKLSGVARGLASGDRVVLRAEWSNTLADIVICTMLSPVDRVATAIDRSEQQLRNLHFAFSLEAYHADRHAYPESLAELSPKYIEKIPDDLFSGKPPHYSRTEKGYVLYSVGPNGKDDGGRNQGKPGGDDDIAVAIPASSRPK